uniref:Uncharacterized protein n=1 Tax=Arundo donax TaxID=35708 RepID=A0A0A9E9X9_ARUDO
MPGSNSILPCRPRAGALRTLVILTRHKIRILRQCQRSQWRFSCSSSCRCDLGA